MKTRIGFVSNSSSSSFVVIGTEGDCSDLLKPCIKQGSISLGTEGKTEFGWGPETLTDIFSRINFARIQSEYNIEWAKMLDKVIMDNTGCDYIFWNLGGMFEGSYIDHSSSAREGENTEIFDSEEDLRRFLFCIDSKIVLDGNG